MIVVMEKRNGGGQAGGRLLVRAENAAFEEMVISDLVPAIDASYRTLSDREHRAHRRAVDGGRPGAPNWLVTSGSIRLHWIVQRRQRACPIGKPRTAVFFADAAAFRKQVKLLWFGAGPGGVDATRRSGSRPAKHSPVWESKVHSSNAPLRTNGKTWRYGPERFRPRAFSASGVGLLGLPTRQRRAIS